MGILNFWKVPRTRYYHYTVYIYSLYVSCGFSRDQLWVASPPLFVPPVETGVEFHDGSRLNSAVILVFST